MTSLLLLKYDLGDKLLSLHHPTQKAYRHCVCVCVRVFYITHRKWCGRDKPSATAGLGAICQRLGDAAARLAVIGHNAS